MTVALYSTVDGPVGAPVLVLGNSLGTSTVMWEPQLAALTEHFRVVRYDHRGHGASPIPDGPYELADLGEDLLALLDKLGLDRVHLGGLSLGGMVAMWVAAHAPERVNRLALLCTSAHLGPPELWNGRIDLVRTGGMAAIAESVIARWLRPNFVSSQPESVAWVREMLLATPAEGYTGCCAAVRDMDLTGDLVKITAPTLVIAGADDPATPPEHANRIAAGIAGATTVTLPDTAHLSNVERPDDVSTLLVDFFGGGA